MYHFYCDEKENCYFSHSVNKKPIPSFYSFHIHEECEFYYFMTGKGTFHIEGTDYPLKHGDILIMNDTESHCIEISPDIPYERCVFHFKKDFVRQFDNNGELLKAFENRSQGKINQYRKEHFENDLYLQLMNNIINAHENKIQIQTCFLALLNEIKNAYETRMTEYSSDGETIINKITNYINNNITSNLSLDLISSKFYMSKSQLCRTFKKSLGTTVWDYITAKRLIKAKNMIDAGEAPTKIFDLCGFSNYTVFYKAYKKQFGIAPGNKGKMTD